MSVAVGPSRAGQVAELRSRFKNSGTVLLLLVLVVLDLILQPSLLSVVQIGLALQIALGVILIAAAQTVVVLTGGLDLSVGGMMSVGNVLAATTLGTMSLGGANIPVIVLAGALMGGVNGLLIAYARYQPVVATLATWAVFNGIALLILPIAGGQVSAQAAALFTSFIGEVPVSYIWLLLLLLAWWLFKRSGFALRLYAVGGDSVRAQLNRIDTRRTECLAYVIAGALACFVGVYVAGTTGGGDPTLGGGYLLPSIAAVVVGGTRLAGGSGGIGNTVIGALALFVLGDIITAMNFSPNVAIAASSLLLLSVVAARGIAARIRA